MKRACKDNAFVEIHIMNEKTFDEMKNIETKYGRGKYKSGPDVFMRAGEIGNWTNFFGDAEKKIFKEKENSALLRLGYEKTEDW